MLTYRNRAHGPGSPEAQTGYDLARLPRDVITEVTWYMEENDITRRELADRLHITPGRVSQILSGGENLTLRTLAAVCGALDAHFDVELVPNKSAAPVSAHTERVAVPRAFRPAAAGRNARRAARV